MADIKITELPETTSISDSDELIVQQPTGTKRTSISNLPAGVPDGGTTGQVLTKQSSTDGDVDWDDIDKMDFVSSPTANDILLTNSSGQAIDSGTSLSTINTNIDKKKVLVITTSNFSSLPQTISNANITSNMVVINSVLSNPSAQTGDWTVTTSNGSLSISGSISGLTTITLYLLEQR